MRPVTWKGLAWGLLAIVACKGDDAPQDEDGTMSTGGEVTVTSTMTGSGTGPGVDETADGTGEDLRPNWHEDIAPLIASNCLGCHTQGAVAPFPMESYEQTWPLGAVMLLQVEARLMPPWHAVETEECEPPAAFKHDARLSDEQIQLLVDWVDLGTPEGDPANAAPIPDPPSIDLLDVDATATMQGSITIQPEGSQLDFFHCISFDPGHTEDVFVDGMQVIPGNDKIVHHVLMYIDPNGDSAAWTDGQSADCGGGAGGISNPQLVGGWVPGAMPIETPEDVGILLPQGARIVYNMHYHAVVTGPETDEGTGLTLRWSTTAPEYVSEFELIGAPGVGSTTTAPFMIPAGATAHEEIVEYEVPVIGLVDVRIWSVLNHMHIVGVDMKTSIVRGGEEICLVQTPRWDFDWQRSYAYDVGIEDTFRVQGGDIVRVRCIYDNSLGNPALVQALNEAGLAEPQDVPLGEGTLDEMCLAGVGVAVRL